MKQSRAYNPEDDCPSGDYNSGHPNGNCDGDGHYLCQECTNHKPMKMTELAKTRMRILFNLDCTFHPNSITHPKGLEISVLELETLSEIQFLKSIEFITT